MPIYQQLSSYISQKGLKQTFVAEKAGLTADNLSKILNGNRRLMADEFLKICSALSLDPKEFQEEQDN